MSPGEQMALTIITAVLTSGGLWAFIQSYFMKKAQNKSAVAIGLQCLLRDRLLQAEKEYTTKGYCESDDKTNMEHMFKAYEDLGGNDVAHAAYKRIIALPSLPPESSADERP